ncbi:prepilin-type N-terminal cleavage/methylation domain-containing protein [Microbacterium tenebrionis]|uniref:prepilin-type N-terminal cleavage/methylation domain-containing protein n=1 Tax=Microbacterium tenebrionis TaxID=2830665 RepID=UPI0015882ADA|nr:prepilin-type N-terminal cleavage/methylation domain-containing protein [Microbacterium ihumii]
MTRREHDREYEREHERGYEREHERGYSLIELIIAMGIFSIFLAMFIGGIVAVSRATNDARTDAQTSSAIGISLQRLERSVRYADAINRPGTVGHRAYVEWRTSAVSASSGVETCSQLRYNSDDGTVALRTWKASASPATGTWGVILRDVRGAATTTYPFSVVAAAGGISNYQGLTVHVIAGTSDSAGTETTTTIYAKNSSFDSISNAVGTNGQSANPVCAGTGYRP